MSEIITLDSLIAESDEVYKKDHYTDGPIMDIVKGPEYAAWVSKSERFLLQNFPDDPQTNRFIEIGEKANGNMVHSFEELRGILLAFNAIPVKQQKTSIDSIIQDICVNFHRCIRSLKDRYSGRGTLEVKDEYDVQDLLRSVLKLFVSDVREEDWVPKYAGGSTRTDFNLPEYKTFIETKMTRNGLSDKEVGEQLTTDILHYKSSCKRLICFIYDPEGRLKNPDGLKRDLENSQVEGLEVKVYVAPN